MLIAVLHFHDACEITGTFLKQFSLPLLRISMLRHLELSKRLDRVICTVRMLSNIVHLILQAQFFSRALHILLGERQTLLVLALRWVALLDVACCLDEFLNYNAWLLTPFLAVIWTVLFELDCDTVTVTLTIINLSSMATTFVALEVSLTFGQRMVSQVECLAACHQPILATIVVPTWAWAVRIEVTHTIGRLWLRLGLRLVLYALNCVRFNELSIILQLLVLVVMYEPIVHVCFGVVACDPALVASLPQFFAKVEVFVRVSGITEKLVVPVKLLWKHSMQLLPW